MCKKLAFNNQQRRYIMNMYQKAIDLVKQSNKPSVSYLQRNLNISYADAVNFLDRMESEKIVSPLDENKKRTVLMKLPTADEMKQMSQEQLKNNQEILSKMPIVQFWRNAKSHPNTSILEGEYQELEKAKLFISESEISTDSGKNKVHKNLQAEPYVGNLATAKCFMINLNPRAGIPYAQEYKNWSDAQLQKITNDVINQKNMAYPFYYLDPELANTDGAKWWLKKFGLQNVGQSIQINGVDLPSVYVKRMIANLFCDIELCPYHSNAWNNKLNDLIVSGKLPSSTMAIEFIKQIIHDPTKHIFIRGSYESSSIAKTLREFIPELKQDLPNVHYTGGSQTFWLTPTSKTGEILYREIFKSV